MADYVANAIWKKYNYKNEQLTKKIPKLYRTFISKFPYKLFANNPSLKQINHINYK